MIDDRVVAAIEGSDTDELIRIVDGYAASRQWEAMAALRHRCDEAVERGKQLWGISEFIRYRFALDGPGEWAGPAVGEGPTRFTLGPLAEVAASNKTWTELAPHLPPGPERAMVAHERVLRGEKLDGAEVDSLVMELPLHLLDWEPDYSLAIYKSDRVEAPTPHRSRVPVEALDADAAPPVEDPEGTRALLAVVEHWVNHSNGRSQAVCVEGRAPQAVGALGLSRAGLAPVDPDLALAWIAWAAASGGAHARRRGGAAGRFNAWWVAHELTGSEWPPDPDELGAAIGELKWYLWNDGSPDVGWALRLAVESPSEGLAWALAAVDSE